MIYLDVCNDGIRHARIVKSPVAHRTIFVKYANISTDVKSIFRTELIDRAIHRDVRKRSGNIRPRSSAIDGLENFIAGYKIRAGSPKYIGILRMNVHSVKRCTAAWT